MTRSVPSAPETPRSQRALAVAPLVTTALAVGLVPFAPLCPCARTLPSPPAGESEPMVPYALTRGSSDGDSSPGSLPMSARYFRSTRLKFDRSMPALRAAAEMLLSQARMSAST